jgi:hypothetical protein
VIYTSVGSFGTVSGNGAGADLLQRFALSADHPGRDTCRVLAGNDEARPYPVSEEL